MQVVQSCVALSRSAGAFQRLTFAKVSSLVKNIKVFGQAFFKRLAGRGAAPHKDTACALQGVNSETVLWTVSGEGRLCKREPPLVIAHFSFSAFQNGTPCYIKNFLLLCAHFNKAIAHASVRRRNSRNFSKENPSLAGIFLL